MKSVEIREDLVRILRLDLVGPEPGGKHESEALDTPPSRWYLTGFLAPRAAGPEQTADETAREEIALGAEGGGKDDDDVPEKPSSRRVFFPSSCGVSVLVPPAAKSLKVEVRWGEYRLVESGGCRAAATWQREPRAEVVEVSVAKPTARIERTPVPRSASPAGGELALSVSVRPVSLPKGADGLAALPEGTRSVAVFLVNDRDPAPDDRRDEAFSFQVGMEITCDRPEGFVVRPNPRGGQGDDWDERVADLQCRDACDYSVGHGVATAAECEGGACRRVRTEWIPSAEVEKVEATSINGVDLRMEALAAATSAAEVRAKLEPLVTAYGGWIAEQAARPIDSGARREIAKALLENAGRARERIGRGLGALDDPVVLEAFRISNRAMAMAARQREAQVRAIEPAAAGAPAWRPFQIAFLLMNLRGIADPLGADGEREVVDLLFFPTGGGKTEAYLGLAVFTLTLRRLRHPGVASAGVSVLMRYTLRLLTLDQLSRAATLLCALELVREEDVEKLGEWPFEIGLWVGQAATPNRMGKKGDKDQYTARARTIAFQNDSRKPSPIPLENCPWCGTKFAPTSFSLVPSADAPLDLRVVCASRRCPFRADRPLPILAVDEPIYRRLPCFVIATVDKFAQLPWVGDTGALFGRVERHDRNGYYGPMHPGAGKPLEGPLPPPDLVIQDELHLISGPLGTMVGLYETAIDALATREVEGGRRVRPKVIASTATVRRAATQIRAVFARSQVEVFPPPGPDRRDSFFAKTRPASERPARRYVGIGAQGRSLKVILLRSYLALLAAAQKACDAAGGKRAEANPADPYMTLLGYFNSLRELGGSRRIVEDEVATRVGRYGSRRRVGEAAGEFADRAIRYDVVELTSREPTSRVAEAKRRLALAFREKEAVDVALATNMISVGLDISRLGLMVVLGQPKTTAEYIQATSRVGRQDEKPGLVVTLFNVHRPRDRSHYERFEAFHQSFYRSVEATSATPFSPRALDRGLAAIAVAMARLGLPALTPARGAEAVRPVHPAREAVAAAIARRAEETANVSGPEAEALRQATRQRVENLMDAWTKIAEERVGVGAGVQYQREEGSAKALLLHPLSPDLAMASSDERKFKANRSLRDVEPSVNLWVRRLDGSEVPAEADE